MDRAVPVAVLSALLVTCVLVGPTVGGAPTDRAVEPSRLSEPAPPAQFDDDRLPPVEMLGLNGGPTRSDVTTQGVDVSTAATMQHAEASAAVDRGALEVAFERAEDDQARRELLFEAATDVEIAISAMRSGQREVRADYVNGTISTRTYVRERAMVDVRAAQLQEDLELIQRYADRVPQLSMRSRIEALQVALTGADGPVTSRIRATASGEASAIETSIAASPNGRALSMVTEDRYVREAYRSDVWTPDTTSGIGFAQAEERMKELYPVAFSPNSSRNVARGMGEYGAGTYRVTMEIREGTIVTYLDGDTENVFFEVREFDLGAIEPGPAATATDNGTRLVVNRTYGGGPLRIATFDNSTGSPAEVPVLVDDTRYRTGPDGVVWAVAPRDTARVVGLAEAGNVSVTHRPVRPPLVNVTAVESGSAGNIEATPREP